MRTMTRRMLMLTLSLLALEPVPAGATAQAPEHLIYKGKTLPLFSEPLERYFSEGPPTYWDEPAFGSSGRRPKAFKASSTACWRGYEGTWTIAEGQLWLVKLEECHGSKVIPLSAVFPSQKKGPVRATWFTGVLRVPLGKRLQYVHMGFGSRYEKDLLLAIRGGKLEGEKTLDNRPDADAREPFRVRPSDDELARGLMTVRASLARCARLTRQHAPVEVEIQPDGSVGSIKLGGKLPGTAAGACLFGALAAARYPSFYGPPVRTTYQLP